MSITSNFPTSKPALNLNFAGSKRLDPRVTFSRSSSGTYVDDDGLIKTAGANRPRFDHDPVTGVCNGLLVEESRTNLLLRSEEFDNASWVKSAATVTTNVIAAPDGSLTADLLVENTANSQHSADLSYTFTQGVTYTASVYVKQGPGSRFLTLNVAGGAPGATFNLSTQTLVTATNGQTNVSASINSLPNGWFRCVLTWTHAVAFTSSQVRVSLSNNPGSGLQPTYTGDGTSGIYIWGAQLEVGSSATSYIPTTSSTVTRASDTILLSGNNFSSFYNTSGGSLVASVIPNRNTSTNQNILTIGDGTTSNNINLIVSPNASGGIYATNSGVRLNTISSGITQSDVSFTGYTDQPLTISSNFSTNNFNLNYNSSGVGTSSSGTLPTSTQMIIGAGVSSTNRFNGTISRISYYPTSLSTSNLSSLSTASPTAAVVSTPNNNQYQFIIRVPSNNYTYTLLTLNFGTYRYNVDWGDGTSTNNITTNNPTKVYKTAGYYKINVTQNTGTFWFYNFGDATYGPNLTYITGTGSSFVWNTNFTSAWYGCSSLTSFPLIDTSNGTNFNSAWNGCTALTSFPLLNTSKVTNFLQTWNQCRSLTSFPLIDTSKGTNFGGTWIGCTSLASFPNLNLSSGTIFNATWFGCGFTSFPAITFGGAGNTNPIFRQTWQVCTNLSSFPAGAFNACTGSTNYISAWTGCGLTSGSIENILTSIVSSGATINTPVPGTIALDGGTNATFSTWTSPAITAFNTLVGAGWTISYNP